MSNGFELRDLFGFEKLVAPKVLKVVYWIGLVGIVILALVSIVGALAMLSYSAASALGTLLLSVVGLAFGALMWRIVIEIYMVFFGIYDRLGEIRSLLETKGS